MADLPTNLKDDILDSSVNTRRRYRMIENPDGTVEFEDMTEYSQVGDEYGAGLINETNRQVNARVEKAVIVRDLDTIGAITQPGFIPDALALKDVNDSLGGLSFGYDSASGKYGYWKKEADTEVFVPFKSAELKTITFAETSKTVVFDEPPIMVAFYNNNNSAISAFYSPIDNGSIGYGAKITKNSDVNYTFNDTSTVGGSHTVLYV